MAAAALERTGQLQIHKIKLEDNLLWVFSGLETGFITDGE